MRTTQYQRLIQLLTRKKGCTTLEAFVVAGCTSLHRRLTDLEQMGYSIERVKVEGQSYKRYFAKPPVKA